MTELEEATEKIAFRLFGKFEDNCLMWEDASEATKEKYRQKAKQFVETVRKLNSPDPQ